MKRTERLSRLRDLARRVGDEILTLEEEIRAETRDWDRHPPCGTDKRYQLHLRLNETPDEPCKAAHALRERLRNPPKVRGRYKPRERAS